MKFKYKHALYSAHKSTSYIRWDLATRHNPQILLMFHGSTWEVRYVREDACFAITAQVKVQMVTRLNDMYPIT